MRMRNSVDPLLRSREDDMEKEEKKMKSCCFFSNENLTDT